MANIPRKDIKKHYDNIKQLSKEERDRKRTIFIRSFNNFIKAVLIKKYVKENMTVLDLGVGKGGDILKYKMAHCKKLVGIDISSKSIEETKRRAEKITSNQFSAEFHEGDAFCDNLILDEEFDIISSQFAFHYAFKNQDNINIALRNIDTYLRSEGYFILTIPDIDTLLRRREKRGEIFGNEYYTIKFFNKRKNERDHGIPYKFTLCGSVNDCEEYTIDYEKLINEMSNYEIIQNKNFLEFFNEISSEYKNLYRRMVRGELKRAEIEIVELYRILIFKKK